jgi:endonuclease YncB( thermonuclease family)
VGASWRWPIGDTLTVLDASKLQHRVRLNGIDAPETRQPFSQVSKDHLSSLVFGQDVIVVGSKVDRYGRLIATVIIGTTNMNLEQLRSGLAWYYREYAADVPVALRPTYEATEAEARAEKRGLWRDPQPIAPWAFRNPGAALGNPPSAAPAERFAAIAIHGSTTSLGAGRTTPWPNATAFRSPRKPPRKRPDTARPGTAPDRDARRRSAVGALGRRTQNDLASRARVEVFNRVQSRWPQSDVTARRSSARSPTSPPSVPVCGRWRDLPSEPEIHDHVPVVLVVVRRVEVEQKGACGVPPRCDQHRHWL